MRQLKKEEFHTLKSLETKLRDGVEQDETAGLKTLTGSLRT
jgi:transketolase N-terminal domain/subunit